MPVPHTQSSLHNGTLCVHCIWAVEVWLAATFMLVCARSLAAWWWTFVPSQHQSTVMINAHAHRLFERVWRRHALNCHNKCAFGTTVHVTAWSICIIMVFFRSVAWGKKWYNCCSLPFCSCMYWLSDNILFGFHFAAPPQHHNGQTVVDAANLNGLWGQNLRIETYRWLAWLVVRKTWCHKWNSAPTAIWVATCFVATRDRNNNSKQHKLCYTTNPYNSGIYAVVLCLLWF